MKRISTLLLFIIIASMLASCTNMVKPAETSDANSISTSDIYNTLVPGETTSPEATDKEDTTSVPEESTVCVTTKEANTTAFETININNPRLEDLFDIDMTHQENDVFF